MTFLPFNRIAILGLGLIGSSLARAVRHFGLAKDLVGHDISPQHMKIAQKLSIVDRLEAHAKEAVSGADLVILCIPVGAFKTCMAEIKDFLEPGVILTDVGSVKTSVIKDLSPLVPEGVFFIPGHPVAGTEYSGPASGFYELFNNRWCILTPQPETPSSYIERLSSFWQACGSKVDLMSAEHHDFTLAITSHLPHLIAFTIVQTAADFESVTSSEVIKYSAGGFRDFTRIAASDPVMWRDVFLNNKTAVLEIIGRFTEDLAQLQKAIRWGDGAKLEETFRQSRLVRQAILEAGQDTKEPDFGRFSKR